MLSSFTKKKKMNIIHTYSDLNISTYAVKHFIIQIIYLRYNTKPHLISIYYLKNESYIFFNYN